MLLSDATNKKWCKNKNSEILWASQSDPKHVALREAEGLDRSIAHFSINPGANWLKKYLSALTWITRPTTATQIKIKLSTENNVP